jgi:hypothetical protein
MGWDPVRSTQQEGVREYESLEQFGKSSADLESYPSQTNLHVQLPQAPENTPGLIQRYVLDVKYSVIPPCEISCHRIDYCRL